MLDQLPQWVKDLNDFSGLLEVLLTLLGAALTVLLYFRTRLLRRLVRKHTLPIKPDQERESLLSKVKARYGQWSQGGFAKHINIHLRYSPALHAVDPYWLGNWHVGDIQPIHDSATIATLYNSSQGQFLLLGDPGTGKSNELHELMHTLWMKASADPAAKVPILLNLSSWAIDKHRDLEDWIARELQTSYQVGAHRSRYWAARVTPLLDGLDEVQEDVRNECLEAICLYAKQPLSADVPPKSLVVSSRPKDYDRLKERVTMPAAQVDRLDPQQLGALLSDPRLAQLKSTIEADDDSDQPRKLREVLDTPLMLALLYECPKAGPSREPDPAFRVYGRFLEATAQRLDGFSPEDAKRWLGWLAASLENRDRARFDLEDLGPDWLPDTRAQRHAGLLFRLVVGLVLGLLLGLVVGLVFGLLLGLVGGLVFGLAGELVVGNDEHPFPAGALGFSAGGARRGLVRGLVVGLVGGLVVGLLLGPVLGPVGGVVSGLVSGLVFGLAFGLDAALLALPVNERTASAEGVYRSLRYAERFAGAGALLAIGLALGFPLVEASLKAYSDRGATAASALRAAPALIAYSGVYLGFSKGGSFALRHYVVRFLLWRRKLAPRRYVPFLTQAANKGILKPVGGGFQFRHRELRRYIAITHGKPWLNI